MKLKIDFDKSLVVVESPSHTFDIDQISNVFYGVIETISNTDGWSIEFKKKTCIEYFGEVSHTLQGHVKHDNND